MDFSGNESQYVSQPDCAGQHSKAGAVRLWHHSASDRNAGKWRHWGRQNAGRNGIVRISLAGNCLSKRPCRKEVPDFCRSNAGSVRPCAVLDESFFWKDGLCIGTGSDAARSRSDIGCSSYGSCTTAICKSCSGDIRSRHGGSDFTGCSGI